MVASWLAALGVFVAGLGCGQRDLTESRYQGMVELEQTDLAFELTGRIASLDVVPGHSVERGQTVARLDDTIDRATRAIRVRELEQAQAALALLVAGTRREDLQAARAQLDAARVSEDVLARDVDRERELVGKGASTRSRLDALSGELARARGERRSQEQRLSALAHGARPEELDRAEAQVAGAREALALADRVLDKHVLISPIDAAVIDVYPEIGEVVGVGTRVASIVQRTHPYADVFVPVADMPKIRLGGPITLAVEGDPREVPGVIERVYPHLEFTPRYVYSPRERPNLLARIRVRLDDRDARLHAGQPAYVRLGEPAREARR
jgi:HlyD family secretion protein